MFSRINIKPLLLSLIMLTGLLSLSQTSHAQFATAMRSGSALPANCLGGNTGQATNFFSLISGGVGTPYYCSQSNVWAPFASSTGISGSNALGNAVVGLGSGFGSQPKAIIDVRDKGVDCTGTTDSSTALNTLFTAITQKEVDIPESCQIRVDHQVTIFGQSQFIIKGLGDRPGAGTAGYGGPSIFGCNGASGAVLYLNRSGYGSISGLGIYPKGNGCTSSFTGSIQEDNVGAGGVTAHNIIYDRLTLTTSPVGGTITGYFGLQWTSGGLSNNNEGNIIRNSWIHCQNSPGSFGVDNEAGAGDKETVEFNSISSCFQNVRMNGGNTTVQHNLLTAGGNFSVFGNGGGTIWLGPCASGPVNILFNEQDFGGQFINSFNDAIGGCVNSNVNIIGNDLFVQDYDTSKFPVNLGSGGGTFIVEGNQINLTQDPTSTIIGSNAQAPAGPIGTIYEFGNTIQNSHGTTFGWCCQTPGYQNGEYHFDVAGPNQYSTINGLDTIYGINQGRLKGGFAAPMIMHRSAVSVTNDDWAFQNTGSQFPANTSSFVFKHMSTKTPWVGFDGTFSGLVIAQITAPAIPAASPIGGTGSTSYTYSVVAYTPTGSVASPTVTVATGVVSLSNSQYIQIISNGTSGATQYCLFRTIGGATQGKLYCIPAIASIVATGGYPINTVNGAGMQYLFKDTGLAGDSTALPGANTTGGASIGGTVTMTGTVNLTGTVQNGSAQHFPVVIWSGTFTLATNAILANTCATAVAGSPTASNALTTDVLNVGFSGDPTGVTGYAPTNSPLTIVPYVAAGNTFVKVCNYTSGSITPGALTLNGNITR